MLGTPESRSSAGQTDPSFGLIVRARPHDSAAMPLLLTSRAVGTA